ncbi:hypothetical protein ACLQ29_29820 [Micromonospora sp. DT228]|uniref:hypothetical protein n=1 Tax=Micromonospora sp. DT228 TaxID=3393443 RepID=UPI003CF8E5BB
MKDLERRYLWLLRAYPADYRRARGAEIVGTYLDLAGPERRWPSPADAADLARGGVRQRLRAVGAAGLIPGVRLAAVLSLLTATALAAVWSVLELRPPAAYWGIPALGPVATLGAGVWVGWLLPALALAVGSARWARRAIGLALLLTVVVVPVAELAGLPRPPLFILLPQVALGLVALALPDRLSMPVRLAQPLTAVGAAAATELLYPWEDHYYYGWTSIQIPQGVGLALLAVTLLLAIGLLVGGDRRGLWAALTLLTPICMLRLHDLVAAGPTALHGGPNVDRFGLAVAATAVTLIGPAALGGAVALAGRARRRTPAS